MLTIFKFILFYFKIGEDSANSQWLVKMSPLALDCVVIIMSSMTKIFVLPERLAYFFGEIYLIFWII